MEATVLSQTEETLLFVEERSRKDIVVGSPHHAPAGQATLPCATHPDSDENAGFLARYLAEKLDCCSVIACNAKIDPNKALDTDYGKEILRWSPAVLVEIHGHGARRTETEKGAVYDVEISLGCYGSTVLAAALGHQLQERLASRERLKDLTYSADRKKIYLKASDAATINTERWVAYHIELPPKLRKPADGPKGPPPSDGYAFMDCVAEALQALHGTRDRRPVIREIARLGELYVNTSLASLCRTYPSRESNWTEGLGFFLAGYAFERQGRPTAFARIACSVLRETAKRFADPQPSVEFGRALWWDFCCRYGDGVSQKNNPLNTAGDLDVVRRCSLLPGDDFNIYVGVLRRLREGRIAEAFELLTSIRGISRKIAPFFLRDVALAGGVSHESLGAPELWQPVDIWVRRVVTALDSQVLANADHKAVALASVRLASHARVSPLLFNAGAWYFGSQLAEIMHAIPSALEGVEEVESLARRRYERLKAEEEALRGFLNLG